MAALTYYLQDAADAEGWESLDILPATAATTTTGWVVGTGSSNHSSMAQGIEQASSTFLSTLPPAGSPALGDSMRSAAPLTGDFAAGDWVAHFVMRAITNGGAQDGRIRFRLMKADATGLNMTEITSGHQQCSIVSNISTSADFDSTLTFNPGAFSLDDEYLFFQIAWERTGAGGMTNSDVHFRSGSSSSAGTRIITSDFTEASNQYTLVVDSATYTLTPTDVTPKYNRKLAVDSVSYSLNDTDVTMLYDRRLNVDSVAYALNAQDISPLYHRIMSVDSSTYALTLQDVIVGRRYTLAVDSLQYDLINQDASFLYNRALMVDSVSYGLTSIDISSLYNRHLAVDSIAYALTAQDVTVLNNRLLAVDSAAYSLSAQNIDALWHHLISVDTISYSLGLQEISLLKNYKLPVDSVVYQLITQDVTLQYSGGSQQTYTLIVDTMSLSLGYNDIGLAINRRLMVDEAIYALILQDATLLKFFEQFPNRIIASVTQPNVKADALIVSALTNQSISSSIRSLGPKANTSISSPDGGIKG